METTVPIWHAMLSDVFTVMISRSYKTFHFGREFVCCIVYYTMYNISIMYNTLIVTNLSCVIRLMGHHKTLLKVTKPQSFLVTVHENESGLL